MTLKEKQLAAKLLNMASDEFGNHGCNDVADSIYEDWTLEERQQFVKDYCEYNGDPSEYDPEFLHLPDFALMGFMAHIPDFPFFGS